MFHVLISALLLTGCSDHTEGVTVAEVQDVQPAAQDPATPPPTEEPAAAGRVLTANGENSSLEWVGAKITKSHPGGFNAFTVEATVDGTTMTALNGTIEIGSLFSDSDRLTGHLLEDDFFGVATFPSATFASTAITATEGANHTVTGVLELHGMQKEISFLAAIVVAEDGTATVDAEFTINRSDWGIVYPGRPDDAIKEQVVVKVDFNLT